MELNELWLSKLNWFNVLKGRVMSVIDTIKCDGASNAIVMPQPFK